MNAKRIILTGIALAAIAMGGCSNTAPTSPATTQTTQSTDINNAVNQPSSLDQLQPQLLITPQSNGAFASALNAGAGGSPDSPQVLALRSLRSATFSVYLPSNVLISSQTTEQIPLSGVTSIDGGETSLTASAVVQWGPAAVQPGTYVVMTVRSTTDSAVRRALIPLGDQ